MAVTGKGVCHASQGNRDLALDQVRDAIERIAEVGSLGQARSEALLSRGAELSADEAMTTLVATLRAFE